MNIYSSNNSFISLYPDDYFEKKWMLKVIERLIKGDELTVSWKYQECHINKWLDNPEKIPNSMAQALINMGFVNEDSGNIETNERHFTFKSGEVYEILKKKYGNGK